MIARSFLLAAVVVPAVASGQQPTARVRLVRCAEASTMPCAAVTVQLDRREGTAAAELNDSAAGAAWHGRLGGVPLAGAGVSSPPSVARGRRLLVLVERSASMVGDRIAFARISLKVWLGALDTAGVRVAVVGFAAADSLHGIDAARFGSVADAIAAIEQLPPPAPRDSASIRSAIARAVDRIDREVPAGPATDGDVLVVAADGSELSPAAGSLGTRWDEPGPAETATRRIWVVAMGAGNGTVSRPLPAANGAVSVLEIPTDPNALADALHRVARELAPDRQLTFGLGATEAAALGRTAMTGHVELRHGDAVLAVRRVSWRPPLVAMPVFEGVADSEALSPALREILLVGGTSSMRSVVALLLALLIVSAWLLVPRLAWSEEEIQIKRSHPSTVTRSDTVATPVVEMAPRRPEDITQQTARRTAMKR